MCFLFCFVFWRESEPCSLLCATARGIESPFSPFSYRSLLSIFAGPLPGHLESGPRGRKREGEGDKGSQRTNSRLSFPLSQTTVSSSGGGNRRKRKKAHSSSSSLQLQLSQRPGRHRQPRGPLGPGQRLPGREGEGPGGKEER